MWPEIRRVATSDGRAEQRRLRAEADVGDGREVAVPAGRHRRQQQRHAIDDQRFRDAVHEPLAQPEEIEVAVQIAREADQRAAVVVAIAVVDAVEPGLNRVLHRPRQQHHDQRREQRDDRVAPAGSPPRNTSLTSHSSTP